jgi:hypothetical protein
MGHPAARAPSGGTIASMKSARTVRLTGGMARDRIFRTTMNSFRQERTASRGLNRRSINRSLPPCGQRGQRGSFSSFPNSVWERTFWAKLCVGGGTPGVGGRAHGATELRGQGRSQTEFGNEGRTRGEKGVDRFEEFCKTL